MSCNSMDIQEDHGCQILKNNQRFLTKKIIEITCSLFWKIESSSRVGAKTNIIGPSPGAEKELYISWKTWI